MQVEDLLVSYVYSEESGIVKFGIRNTTVPKETFLEGTREQLWTVMLKRRPCRLQTVQTECYFFTCTSIYYSFLLPLIMCTVHHHHMLH